MEKSEPGTSVAGNNNSRATNVTSPDSNGDFNSSHHPEAFNVTPMRMYTGFPEAIQKRLIQPNIGPEMYELYGKVISIAIVTHEATRKEVALRFHRTAIIRAVYYVNDNIEMQDFPTDTWIRCIGIKMNKHALRVFSVRTATREELSVVQRLTYLADQADKPKFGVNIINYAMYPL